MCFDARFDECWLDTYLIFRCVVCDAVCESSFLCNLVTMPRPKLPDRRTWQHRSADAKFDAWRRCESEGLDPHISIAPADGFPRIEHLFTCSWHPDNLALSISLGHEELVEVEFPDEEREDDEPAEDVEESTLCRDEDFAADGDAVENAMDEEFVPPHTAPVEPPQPQPQRQPRQPNTPPPRHVLDRRDRSRSPRRTTPQPPSTAPPSALMDKIAKDHYDTTMHKHMCGLPLQRDTTGMCCHNNPYCLFIVGIHKSNAGKRYCCMVCKNTGGSEHGINCRRRVK